VQSVERAVRILKSFNPETPERGVSELSRELGLHKSTVSRLMATLERGGLLTRNPETERYRLGVDLIGLGAQVVSHLDIREVARPLLRKLAEQCQETVNLVVLDAEDVVNLEQYVPASRRIRSFGWVGRRMPPHCTAAGKALLAYLPFDQVMQILPPQLECFTERTISNRDEFMKALDPIRSRGYSTAEEELEPGLNVVAAPVFDHLDRVAAAVSISGPSFRVTPALFPSLAERLIAVSSEISRQMGHR
jgi:DNA-binding IclR family transcriptional regulator